MSTFRFKKGVLGCTARFLHVPIVCLKPPQCGPSTLLSDNLAPIFCHCLMYSSQRQGAKLSTVGATIIDLMGSRPQLADQVIGWCSSLALPMELLLIPCQMFYGFLGSEYYARHFHVSSLALHVYQPMLIVVYVIPPSISQPMGSRTMAYSIGPFETQIGG